MHCSRLSRPAQTCRKPKPLPGQSRHRFSAQMFLGTCDFCSGSDYRLQAWQVKTSLSKYALSSFVASQSFSSRQRTYCHFLHAIGSMGPKRESAFITKGSNRYGNTPLVQRQRKPTETNPISHIDQKALKAIRLAEWLHELEKPVAFRAEPQTAPAPQGRTGKRVSRAIEAIRSFDEEFGIHRPPTGSCWRKQ